MIRSKLIAVAVLSVLIAGPGVMDLEAQRGPRVGRGRGAVPPIGERPPIQDVIEGLYVSRLQQELELDDNEFARMLPSVRESLDERTRLGRERQEAFDALRQAVDEGASETVLDRLIERFDQTDRQLRAVQENLLRDIDPQLSTEQRARFRIAQPNVENRIRALIESSRGR